MVELVTCILASVFSTVFIVSMFLVNFMTSDGYEDKGPPNRVF